MIYDQIQDILLGTTTNQELRKSENAPLSEQVKHCLNKSYVPAEITDEAIEKAANHYGNLIPERRMNSLGRMVTYWVSPEDRNKGKLQGQQNLFGDDDLSDQQEPETSYAQQADKDIEDYQIKPLIDKFRQYDKQLAERLTEKYKVYQWDRDTKDLDIKLDFDTLDYMRKAKNDPANAKEWQQEYNEKTDRTCKMLNNRKLAMARLKVGSIVNYNGKKGKITGFSKRGFPNVDFGGKTRTCFVEEIADIDELVKRLKAA